MRPPASEHTTDPAALVGDGPVVVVGMGVTGRASVAALSARGVATVAVDDRPSATLAASVAALGTELVATPGADELDDLVAAATAVMPTPGLPETHPAFDAAARRGVPIVGELDLAASWDRRPTVCVTGTDGKTTVVTLIVGILEAAGRRVAAAGNLDLPLVAAIDDPEPELFVVEASSFRLAPLRTYRPVVGTWLNHAPDHLDIHRDAASYEAAKANLWGRHGGNDIAVANADDPTVMAHARHLGGLVTFGQGRAPATAPHWSEDGEVIRAPSGEIVAEVATLWRRAPADRANALAAAATAAGVGASGAAIATGLAGHSGLPHRVQPVGEAGGVGYYDDSKATTPHATVAAVAGFDSVVLIAGGRNKGLDLAPLADVAGRVRAVVAIGEAAGDVSDAIAGRVPVARADTMAQAVERATGFARSGDVVLLSPGCASFDWYRSYAERGDDFGRWVAALSGPAGSDDGVAGSDDGVTGWTR